MKAYALSYATQALYLVLILSAPPVLTAMVVGLLISLLQATTQVQEQTLTFVPKMVAICLVIALFGSWGMDSIVDWMRVLLDAFPKVIAL